MEAVRLARGVAGTGPRGPGGRMDRAGLKLGALAGLVGIACCVSPVVLVLLGLSSVSFAISLGNTLYYEYGWYFRGAALLLAAGGVMGILRRRRSCTLRGARAQWRLLISVVLLMVAVYAALYGLTAYLARAAS
ncbi:MAG: hypothetical protein A2X51_09070 [Candidatus Rokubacteria bacterium GWC2_70_24]|nr:MAG: hypothetical protein A2X51_09070 [Candidatus Rokubacteria bacterium GWC2_70_24]